MENAVDALKIAFAVFVLVMALTVSIISFNNAKSAADIILYTKDKTNYYYNEIKAGGEASENRIVGLETVIPTLFRYYKENYTVVFKSANYNEETEELTNVEYLPVYQTNSNKKLWELSYDGKDGLMNKKYGIDEEDNINIFSFDLDEETLRHEPWTGSVDKAKSNLDAFLNGSEYTSPVTNKPYKNYGNDDYLKKGVGFVGTYKDSKFIETISEYVYSSDADKSDIGKATKEKKKRVITYTLIR